MCIASEFAKILTQVWPAPAAKLYHVPQACHRKTQMISILICNRKETSQ